MTDQGAGTSGVHERAKRISGPVAHQDATDARSAPPVAAAAETSEPHTQPDSPRAMRACRPSIASVRPSSRWELVRQWLERWRRPG